MERYKVEQERFAQNVPRLLLPGSFKWLALHGRANEVTKLLFLSHYS